MTQREKNSLGLFLLVLVMLAFFALASPLFRFSVPRLFVHDLLGARGEAPGMTLLHGGVGAMTLLPLLFLYVLWAGVAIWVYRDAERRGQNGLLWALFVFVGNIIGLILYLLLRSGPPVSAPPAEGTAADCPGCGRPVLPSYVACPHCARPLAGRCAACGKRLEPDWKACPYCGSAVKDD